MRTADAQQKQRRAYRVEVDAKNQQLAEAKQQNVLSFGAFEKEQNAKELESMAESLFLNEAPPENVKARYTPCALHFQPSSLGKKRMLEGHAWR